MTPEALVDKLSGQIRQIYADNPRQAAARIETLLKENLTGLTPRQSHGVIKSLAQHFRKPSGMNGSMDCDVMTRVFSLLLGRKVAPDDLSSTEMLERLAQSLNTIFDALNRLISMINTSFSGPDSGEKTIRQFIGFHLGGEDQTRSLEEYLGQINHAFLMTHEAFKATAKNKVEQILHAVNPDSVAAERGSGLKIGPLRKAEDFDILKGKIERIRKWFDSGRFMEDFLRDFEKNCQSFNRK